MDLTKQMQRVAVVGAGGKMGSGISLLLAQEMTLQSLQSEHVGTNFQLALMDISADALDGLQQYLAKQTNKFAQKNSELLTEYFPGDDATSIVEKFVAKMQSLLRPVTDLSEISNQQIIFEAVLEKLDLKVNIFNQLKQSNPDAYFMSNTSSIPIHELDAIVGMGGRIIGFHFYNPPAIQKLVELIIPEKVDPKLPELSKAIGKKLRKIIVPSNDIAGFIGNGHFMRDGLHGIHEAEHLMKEGMSFPQAIYTVNRISQDFLLRPMGIFQLIDYVGLDIFQSILKIMNPHFPKETLHSRLIDGLVAAGVKGGQFSDGSQKDGFLKYEGGKVVGVYDNAQQKYLSIHEGRWQEVIDSQIGELPESHEPWKTLLKDVDRDGKLQRYFSDLSESRTLGAKLAINYLKHSKSIGEHLVSGGVADSADDVNSVLMNGFFHLYGPVNSFV